MKRHRPNTSDSLESHEIQIPYFGRKLKGGSEGSSVHHCYWAYCCGVTSWAGTSAPSPSLHGAEGRQTQSLLPMQLKLKAPLSDSFIFEELERPS